MPDGQTQAPSAVLSWRLTVQDCASCQTSRSAAAAAVHRCPRTRPTSVSCSRFPTQAGSPGPSTSACAAGAGAGAVPHSSCFSSSEDGTGPAEQRHRARRLMLDPCCVMEGVLSTTGGGPERCLVRDLAARSLIADQRRPRMLLTLSSEPTSGACTPDLRWVSWRCCCCCCSLAGPCCCSCLCKRH